MTFEEHKDQIKFLYKFKEGCVPHSFGINVAKLAGLPVFLLNIDRFINNFIRFRLLKSLLINQNHRLKKKNQF